MNRPEEFIAVVPSAHKLRVFNAISTFTPVLGLFITMGVLAIIGKSFAESIPLMIVAVLVITAVTCIAKGAAAALSPTVNADFASEFEAKTGVGFPNNYPVVQKVEKLAVIPISNGNGTTTEWLVTHRREGFRVTSNF